MWQKSKYSTLFLSDPLMPSLLSAMFAKRSGGDFASDLIVEETPVLPDFSSSKPLFCLRARDLITGTATNSSPCPEALATNMLHDLPEIARHLQVLNLCFSLELSPESMVLNSSFPAFLTPSPCRFTLAYFVSNR